MAELARLLNIVDGADERLVPRNVGLLFFCETPEQFMPGTQIDVVIFPEGAGGDQIVEKILHGPIHQQIRDALRYIENNIVVEKVLKHPDRAEATRFFNYPMAAIKEALVNAMYHRGYDQREPVEVRVNPESIEIISYPGLDPSIRASDLKKRKFVSRRYRNRRIGEFLKELEMTEGRSTGVPKIYHAMARNGSPTPKFEADESRYWFRVELLIHKGFRDKPRAKSDHGAAESGAASESSGDHVGTKSAPSRHQVEILEKCREDTGITALMELMQRKDRTKFRQQVLNPLLEAGWIEMTIPDKPRSSKQEYRITPQGRAVLKSHGKALD